MRIHRLSSTDAFIAFDLDDAPASGVTRLARKILQDGAELLARSTTYAFASFEVQMGGASAGINAEGDTRDAAVEAFIAEVIDLVADGRWATDPGLGLTEPDFAPLRNPDPRPAALWSEGLGAELNALGAIAAAGEFVSIDGARVVVDGNDQRVVDDLRSAGAEIVAETHDTDRADALATPCDVVFAGGKAGSIDHEIAATLDTKLVVPFAPVPVTAKAFAVLGRAGVGYVPDFVATAAPLLAGHDLDGGEPVERVRSLAAELVDAEPTPWMAAVERAEAFLATWRDELPFGRPLA